MMTYDEFKHYTMIEYKLGMDFIDESAPFAYGFECGRIWEQLKSGNAINQYIHACNSAQIVMMCEHYQREYEFEEMGEGWLNLKVK